MNSFRKNLKLARIQKGLMQQDLADLLGIKQASISQYERGDRVPPIQTIKAIAKVLQVSMSELIGDDGEVIGISMLMSKVRGLSTEAVEHLCEVAAFLRYKEND